MAELKKQVAGAAVLATVLLAGGWTLLVGPERSEAADLREQVVVEESRAQQLQTQLGVLRDKAAGLPAQEAALAEVDRLLPAEAAMPELVRALTEASRSAGVDLVSVAPGPPVAVSAGAPDAAQAAPAPVDAEAPPVPAPATGTLLALPVSLDVSGGFYDLEQFLADLEDLPRALRVTGLTMTAGSAGEGDVVSSRTRTPLTLKLTAEVYVSAPATAATAPGAQTAPTTGGALPAPDGAVATPLTES